MTPKIAIDINECVTAFVIVPSFAPTGATTEIAASDKPSARDHLTLRIDDGSAGARPCRLLSTLDFPQRPFDAPVGNEPDNRYQHIDCNRQPRKDER
jgi:hypothetical protein